VEATDDVEHFCGEKIAVLPQGLGMVMNEAFNECVEVRVAASHGADGLPKFRKNVGSKVTPGDSVARNVVNSA